MRLGALRVPPTLHRPHWLIAGRRVWELSLPLRVPSTDTGVKSTMGDRYAGNQYPALKEEKELQEAHFRRSSASSCLDMA